MATRVISIMNQKGGVGKTTTALNLGAALAQMGRRVLLIDLDPQANLTHGLGLRAPDLSASVYELLTNPKCDAGVLIRKTAYEGLDLIPSHIDLSGAEIEMVPMIGRETRLKRSLGALQSPYDYVLIDCLPSLSLLTVNAMVASAEALVPLQAHPFALEGLGKLFEVVGMLRDALNPELRVSGVLVTMFDSRTNVSRETMERLKADARLAPHLFATLVRTNIKIAESQNHGVPVVYYDAKSPGALAYRAVAEELLEMEAGCLASEARPRLLAREEEARAARRTARAARRAAAAAAGETLAPEPDEDAGAVPAEATVAEPPESAPEVEAVSETLAMPAPLATEIVSTSSPSAEPTPAATLSASPAPAPVVEEVQETLATPAPAPAEIVNAPPPSAEPAAETTVSEPPGTAPTVESVPETLALPMSAPTEIVNTAQPSAVPATAATISESPAPVVEDVQEILASPAPVPIEVVSAAPPSAEPAAETTVSESPAPVVEDVQEILATPAPALAEIVNTTPPSEQTVPEAKANGVVISAPDVLESPPSAVVVAETVSALTPISVETPLAAPLTEPAPLPVFAFEGTIAPPLAPFAFRSRLVDFQDPSFRPRLNLVPFPGPLPLATSATAPVDVSTELRRNPPAPAEPTAPPHAEADLPENDAAARAAS